MQVATLRSRTTCAPPHKPPLLPVVQHIVQVAERALADLAAQFNKDPKDPVVRDCHR